MNMVNLSAVAGDTPKADPTNTPLRFMHDGKWYEARFDRLNCRTEIWRVGAYEQFSDEPLLIIEDDAGDEMALKYALDGYGWGLLTGKVQGRREKATEIRKALEVE